MDKTAAAMLAAYEELAATGRDDTPEAMFYYITDMFVYSGIWPEKAREEANAAMEAAGVMSGRLETLTV